MTPIYTHYTPTEETEKWQSLGKKYQETEVFYVIHEKIFSEKRGEDTRIVFASRNRERAKQKAKKLEQENREIIVVKVEPQKQQSRWIYETHKHACSQAI